MACQATTRPKRAEALFAYSARRGAAAALDVRQTWVDVNRDEGPETIA